MVGLGALAGVPGGYPLRFTFTLLPSAFAKRRTEISRRMSHLMDNFLTKATLASQQINTYTGTDFSGIEALRNEIVAQEKQVKARHAAVTTQKDKHMEAHVK
ncbi:MAG: hypothetical protein EOO59_11380, partial [Hymenobacter sp.]